MNCNTTHYRANSSSVPGDPTLTLGAFKKWCARPRAWVRYVADSSYWMYLVHLPIVVWLQVALAEMEWHWSLKLAGISATTIVLSLLTYDLLVRSTWVGWLLNGRRRERALMPSWFGGNSTSAVKLAETPGVRS